MADDRNLTIRIPSSLADTESLCDSQLDLREEQKSERQDSKVRKVNVVCLVGSAAKNEELRRVLLDTFKVELLTSEDGIEYMENKEVVFLCDDFDSSPFNYLNSNEKRIMGPTIVFECASACKELPVPRKNRPLYCWSMKGVTVWNTGLTKNETKHILALVHFMGGSVRKDISQFATHMIAKTVKGDKYRCAVSAGKQVMHPNWVEECWQKRSVPNTSALSKTFVNKHLLRPFCGLKIALYAFSGSETGHMSEQIEPLGGMEVSISDREATHLVVDHFNTDKAPLEKPSPTCHAVTAEWFWVSIQLGVCANETLYSLDGGGGNNARRQSRKRSALSPAQSEPLRATRKTNLRKSSSQDGWLSLDALESSNVSETLPDHIFSTDDIESLLDSSPRKSSAVSKRQQVCMELLQTERNYVEVLRTILKTFKEPLDNMHDEELLTKSELTLIFGKIPPLLAVHENICHELVNLVSHWSEERPIGAVWLNAVRIIALIVTVMKQATLQASELQRVYPSFINSFDAAKELLKECDRTKPKFHAFLKACQSRSECQRQTLVELLIRPVQRLASVQLLLKDILKRTDKSNGDFEQLQMAIQSIEGVLKNINEAKRKTEDRVKIFEICNDIENVPPELVSSQRSFITEIDAVSLNGCGDTKKGQAITLYLFNDLLEVTKRRNRSNVPRSPATFRPSKGRTTSSKGHKHIDCLSLSAIRKVEDVTGCEEADGLFLLTIRDNSRGLILEEEQWTLQVADNYTEADKRAFLSAIANEVLRIISSRDVGVLEFAMDDPNAKPERVEALKQAIKLSRALPKRTGSRMFAKPNTLRRAVSNMSLGWSKTLSRMSRSNLRMAMLDESVVESTSVGPSTPSKHGWTWGPRKMLTQQSFVAPSPGAARRESAVSTKLEYPMASGSQV